MNKVVVKMARWTTRVDDPADGSYMVCHGDTPIAAGLTQVAAQNLVHAHNGAIIQNGGAKVSLSEDELWYLMHPKLYNYELSSVGTWPG